MSGLIVSHYGDYNCDSKDQSSNWQSIATPRRTQCSGSILVLTPIYITKLVEWPVVDNSPLLVDVL